MKEMVECDDTYHFIAHCPFSSSKSLLNEYEEVMCKNKCFCKWSTLPSVNKVIKALLSSPAAIQLTLFVD